MPIRIIHKYYHLPFKNNLSSIFSIDDKGPIAINIVIYYRHIPKKQRKHSHEQKEGKENLKMTVFTNTM
jgi:hypothetical protein